MGEKVVGLRGGLVPSEVAEPAANVVERCRELLAMAEAGDLRGLAIATFRRHGAGFFWSHDDADRTCDGIGNALLSLSHAWSMDNCEIKSSS